MPSSQFPSPGQGNGGSPLAGGSSGGEAGALGDPGVAQGTCQGLLWDLAEIGVSQHN